MKIDAIALEDSTFNSRLSFKPLVNALKKMLTECKPGSKKLYGDLVTRFESVAELMQPQDDCEVVKKHRELVEMLLAIVFPPTGLEEENHAISFPFKFRTIYTSRIFQQFFLKPGTEEINIPDEHTASMLAHEKLLHAYCMILKKFGNYHAPQTSRAIYPITDPVSGLKKYLEVKVDTRFIDVRTIDGSVPQLPENVISKRTNQLMKLHELQRVLPLNNFIFEGLAIIRVNDVTQLEVISEIKNTLLNINAFSDASVYATLQTYIESLLRLKNVKIGITPFFKLGGHHVYSQLHNTNSFLFKHFAALQEKEEVKDCCQELFYESDTPIVFETVDDVAMREVDYLRFYYDTGCRSLILCPLKHNNELIGVLEIVSEEPGKLNNEHIGRIESAIPLFTLALEKSAESLSNQIDNVIKEKFTAVQPAVEWKFSEVALNYISKRQSGEDVKIEKITFDDVYPLYAAVDIRNSSTQRAHAIQMDLIEQLHAASDIMQRIQKKIHFPLLKEIEFKIQKYITSASDVLLSDEEITIHEFLKGQVAYIFNHLMETEPGARADIEKYFARLDAESGLVYNYRKKFEESITAINEAVARFIDVEQASAQLIYPHYFERYVTDGAEFNIYIGQSIAPRRKFNEIYLRNLKMWQLVVLAKTARLTRKMEPQLSNLMQTTQLILAHSIPISISFRISERKFDVDGAYNIRYEIIKKRIDKVHIKATSERLTQPGKIAIVYTQPKEAAEYEEFIEFLQSQQLLKPGIEKLELEELHGVLGLKALRVDVDFEEEASRERKIELSSTTSQQLLGG